MEDEEDTEDRDGARYNTLSWPQYDRIHQRFILLGNRNFFK